MANLISFNYIATYDEFKKLKVSANPENTQYMNNGSIKTGTPDIKWGSIIFIEDIQQIYYNMVYYGKLLTINLGELDYTSYDYFLKNGYLNIPLSPENKFYPQIHEYRKDALYNLTFIKDSYDDNFENIVFQYMSYYNELSRPDGDEYLWHTLKGTDCNGNTIILKINDHNLMTLLNKTFQDNTYAICLIDHFEVFDNEGNLLMLSLCPKYLITLWGTDHVYVKLQNTNDIFHLNCNISFSEYELYKTYTVYISNNQSAKTRYDYWYGCNLLFDTQKSMIFTTAHNALIKNMYNLVSLNFVNTYTNSVLPAISIQFKFMINEIDTETYRCHIFDYNHDIINMYLNYLDE